MRQVHDQAHERRERSTGFWPLLRVVRASFSVVRELGSLDPVPLRAPHGWLVNDGPGPQCEPKAKPNTVLASRKPVLPAKGLGTEKLNDFNYLQGPGPVVTKPGYWKKIFSEPADSTRLARPSPDCLRAHPRQPLRAPHADRSRRHPWRA